MSTYEFALPPRTKIQELKDMFCDCHKDVYGVKARWVYDLDLTEAELVSMLAQLEVEYKAVQKQEAARQAAAEVQVRSQIKSLIDHGAYNVVRAIRWLHDSYNTDNDNRYLDHKLGVQYGFIDNIIEKGL